MHTVKTRIAITQDPATLLSATDVKFFLGAPFKQLKEEQLVEIVEPKTKKQKAFCKHCGHEMGPLWIWTMKG